MPHNPYKSLYVHIPYCVMRCNYCNFCTKAIDFDSPEIDEYIEKLIFQIRTKSKEGELSNIETIYIGGGTPSFIGSKRLCSLLYAISTSINLDKVKEFSMEANPESINSNLVKDIWALGVNRLSVGVQSFDDDILKMLGRAHNSKKAIDAIFCAKKRFENISIDLMCGIPGQSTKVLESSLNQFIDLSIPHISVYPLSVEYNTVFYKWTAQGKIDKINDDIQAEHMEITSDILKLKNFEHYEIASFSKSGFQCSHNLNYWRSISYLGLGLSATTMTQNSERRMRVTDNNVEDDLDPKQMLAEDLMLAMRTKYGIDKDLYDKSIKVFNNFEQTIDDLLNKELIVKDDNNIVPTQKGWLCGNDMFSDLLSLGDKSSH